MKYYLLLQEHVHLYYFKYSVLFLCLFTFVSLLFVCGTVPTDLTTSVHHVFLVVWPLCALQDVLPSNLHHFTVTCRTVQHSDRFQLFHLCSYHLTQPPHRMHPHKCQACITVMSLNCTSQMSFSQI